MRVFLAGCTGLIGSRLIRRLRQAGHTLNVLTRRPAFARERFGSDCNVVEGDPMQPGAWMDAVSPCDAVINLTGEGIFNRRWSESFKSLLRESRVKSTENIIQALARNPRAPGSQRALVNASAIGYYGPHGDEELTEDSPAGDDALARICVDWEAAAHSAEPLGIRVVIVRVGVVLDREGGALKQMLTPFKLFAGGPVGSGKQWVSWIHHEDIVGIFQLGLENPSALGPINGTAPSPVTNRDFSRALGRALHRPAFVPTPRFALRLGLGEVAEIVTKGQRVLPRKAAALGYSFRYTDVEAALRDTVAR
jgi:uncharacterized protein (TIGR01777 family)